MNIHDFNKKFVLNNEVKRIDAYPGLRLSEFIREKENLKGTKVGCNAGDCGSCTVLVDNNACCSCLITLAKVENKKVETIEGIKNSELFSKLKDSFSFYGAAQCGICTPGMLMASVALLRKNKNPNIKEVEEALSGVLCRCTGYRKILLAVSNVHKKFKKEADIKARNEVGKRLERLDGKEKIEGTDIFGDDYHPKGSLIAKVIRSPYNTAKFSFGNIKKWKKNNPGVEIILTANDIPGINKFGVIPNFDDQPALAYEKTKFRGEAVAIIAGSPDKMKDLKLSDFPIYWEPENETMDITEALNKKNPNIHDKKSKNNILIVGKVKTGNVDIVSKNSFEIKGKLETSYVEHAYIEPEAGSSWLEGDILVIQACTQAPYMDRDDTAKILGLEKNKVRIIPSSAGGGFGSKLDVSLQPLLGLVTLKTKKPCRLTYSRKESMISTTKRHPAVMKASISSDQKGKILSMKFHGDFNTGAYASWGPTVANRVPIHASGPYRIPNYQAIGRAIYTNGPVSGAFRGFGVPQAAAIQETLLDQLAEKCNIDPLEFRIINALKDGDTTVCGQVLPSIGIHDCLKSLKSIWKRAKEKAEKYNKNSTRFKKGVGIASCWYGCGNTALPNPSTIKVGIKKDGNIYLHQGATDIGQGSNTVITQICADALGLPVENFKLIGPDTFKTADCGKTSASRQTFITGKAAYLAGKSLRSKILRMSNMGQSSTIKIEGNKLIILNENKSQTIELEKITQETEEYVVLSQETYDPPTMSLDENGQGKPYAVYGYGVQLVEIEVDTFLGLIDIKKITASHDLGKVINPLLAEGQIEGGIAQGIGFALMEEYIPNKTENLHDYLIPSIGDVPEIECIFVEKKDPEGPYGARGLGEHVLIPTAPAILNAIRNATGAIITKLPALPHRVLQAISEAKNVKS